MKVAIDTCVLLAGALRPNTWAGRLHWVTSKAQLCTSDVVLSEAIEVLDRKSPRDLSTLVTNHAKKCVSDFRNQLGLSVLASTPGAQQGAKRTNDEILARQAIESGCDALCTYNFQDFVGSGIPTLSPLSLIRQIDPELDPTIEEMPSLNGNWTYMLCGRSAQRHSIGRLLKDRSGNQIGVHSDGRIAYWSKGGRKPISRSVVSGTDGFVAVIRLRNGCEIDVLFWENEDGYAKPTIADLPKPAVHAATRVNCSPPFYPINEGFNGWFVNRSAVPRFVAMPGIESAVMNRTLEAQSGSLSVEFMLNRLCIGFMRPYRSREYSLL